MRNRECNQCVYEEFPSTQEPCDSCLDWPNRPHFERAEGPKVEPPTAEPTKVEALRCRLCGDVCRPEHVVDFVDGHCDLCHQILEQVRRNPLLYRKILRQITQELIDHD